MGLRRRPAQGHPRAGAEGGRTQLGTCDRGNSTVEFTLVTGLLLFLFLGILQLGFVLHTRNVLIAAAQDGARYGANADRGPSDAAARARQVVSEALSPGAAARMSSTASVVNIDGLQAVEVTLSGPLPLVFLPAGPMRLTVRGHALDEG